MPPGVARVEFLRGDNGVAETVAMETRTLHDDSISRQCVSTRYDIHALITRPIALHVYITHNDLHYSDGQTSSFKPD